MENEKMMDEMMGKRVWAVVGVTPDSNKISNRIHKTFLSHGYETYAVNPIYEGINDGIKYYRSLEALPKPPECAIFVVSSEIILEYLQKTDPRIIPYIWFQPGTYNDGLVEYAKNRGFKVVYKGACAMEYLLNKQANL